LKIVAYLSAEAKSLSSVWPDSKDQEALAGRAVDNQQRSW
jgi:hypothetical protein